MQLCLKRVAEGSWLEIAAGFVAINDGPSAIARRLTEKRRMINSGLAGVWRYHLLTGKEKVRDFP